MHNINPTYFSDACEIHDCAIRAPVEPERTGTPFRFLFGRTVVQNLGLLALPLSSGRSSHETDVVDADSSIREYTVIS